SNNLTSVLTGATSFK
ncbi:hypothetical protein, partial [Klebsiella michiganensis]